MSGKKRIVVGISGASGAAIGLRILELLHARDEVEAHLVITAGACRTFELELGSSAIDRARHLAAVCHDIGNIAASIASGSFVTDGMIVAPCSMRTLSAIAYGLSDNLLVRAADVALKERRRLVLVARETPLHLGHLETMVRAARIGAVVMPPAPAFYARPRTIDEVVTQIAARAIDLVGLPMDSTLYRWNGADADA